MKPRLPRKPHRTNNNDDTPLPAALSKRRLFSSSTTAASAIRDPLSAPQRCVSAMRQREKPRDRWRG
ncbi:uncharacterized, partial [Tachysurus ichikawai]